MFAIIKYKTETLNYCRQTMFIDLDFVRQGCFSNSVPYI